MARTGTTITEAELTDFLSERLAAFKVPSRVQVVDESLPRNASGKILKRELRDRLV